MVDSTDDLKVAHLADPLAVDLAALKERHSVDWMVVLMVESTDLLKAGKMAVCSGDSTAVLMAASMAFQMAAKMVDLRVVSSVWSWADLLAVARDLLMAAKMATHSVESRAV